MRKLLGLLALVVIFGILVVGNIVIYKNDFRALGKSIKTVEYWSIYRDGSNAKQLEQKIKTKIEAESKARGSYNRDLQRQNLYLLEKIQDEAATRVSYNWGQQKEISNLKREISKLKIIGSKPVQYNLVNSIQDTIGSVVHISNLSRGWQGSGVSWSEDIIVTARHVVEGGTDFEITLNNGDVIKATEAISSEKYDIGFIKINEKILSPAKFGSVKDTVLGQQVYVIGSPYGKLNFNSVTLGIVSGLDREFDLRDYYSNKDYGWNVAFTTDSAGMPGNSGCPVFTIDKIVRGILVGGFSPVLIICVPVDLFLGKLEVIEMMFEQRKFYDEKPLYDYNQSYNSNKEWSPFEIK